MVEGRAEAHRSAALAEITRYSHLAVAHIHANN
jgi:hypothetical protein